MKTTKETIKSLGSALRSSNPEHQAALKARLMEQHADTDVRTRGLAMKPLVFSGAGLLAVIVLVVGMSSQTRHDVVYAPADDLALTSDGAEFGFDAVSEEALFGEAAGTLSYADMAFEPMYVPEPRDQDVIDYEDDHGSMLEQTLTFTILPQEDGAVDAVTTLYASLGGHVSKISSYAESQTTITGLVPLESLALFQTQLADLVKNDAFISQSQSATDLIPQAMSLDESVAMLEAQIAELQGQISAETEVQKKQQLEAQLERTRESLANMQEARENLDDRVDLVSVTVVISDLPTFWTAESFYDVQVMIGGIEERGLMQRAYANVLYGVLLGIQITSMTFWIVIPIAIWLFLRRKNKRLLAEFD